MARDSRTILALKREKDIIKKNIINTERDCGHQLFQNTNTQLVTKAERATYYSYDEKNSKIRDNIVKIKELVDNLQETKKDIKESISAENALISQWSVWYKTLGQMIYRHYIPLFESVFGEYYTKIQAQQKKRDKVEKTALNIKKTIERQGFFSRLFTQVKYASIHNSLTSYDNKLDLLLEKGGKIAYTSSDFSQILNHDEVDATVRRAYYSCQKLENDIGNEHKNTTNLSKKEIEIKAQLQQLSATGFGEKRLQELRREIDSNIKDQNTFAAEKAHLFANTYMDMNGIVQKDFPESFGNSLNMIANLRMEQVSVKRRIQIQELVEKIAAAIHELKVNTKKIKSNTKKIEALTLQNKELSIRNEILQSQQKDWENLKVSLDLAEATNVKHLKSTSQNA